MNDAIRMQLSAFVDGELPDNEAELLLRRMSQDAELRAEVAEYLAIGRLIRGDVGLAGADQLNKRVAVAIDDHEKPIVEESVVSTVRAAGAIRPLAGVAIAATVALAAIFALQQNAGVGEVPTEGPIPIAADHVPNVDAQQERQRQFFRSHSETSTENGANSLNSRVVTLSFSEEIEYEPEVDADENEEAATQP